LAYYQSSLLDSYLLEAVFMNRYAPWAMNFLVNYR